MGLLYLYLYPLHKRLGGPKGHSGRMQKISPLPGFDPRKNRPINAKIHDSNIWKKVDVNDYGRTGRYFGIFNPLNTEQSKNIGPCTSKVMT